MRFPDREPEALEHSCALDVADQNPDGLTLDTVGALLNLTRERVRQWEVEAARRVRAVTGAELGIP